MINNDPIILISSAVIILIIMLVGVVVIFKNYQNRKNQLHQNELKLKLNLQAKEIEQLQALEKQRRRIYNDLHDNIGSTLAAAKLQSNYLKSSHSESDKLEEFVELESMVAQSYEQLKEIVWYMSNDKDRLEDLVEFVKDYSYSFLSKTSVALQFQDSLQTPKTKLSANLRKDVYYSIKELLHNIIKHADANKAWVQMSQDRDQLIVTVRDNGNGIKESKEKINSNGHKSIENRVMDHKGDIQISSTDGLQVTLTFELEEQQ